MAHVRDPGRLADVARDLLSFWHGLAVFDVVSKTSLK